MFVDTYIRRVCSFDLGAERARRHYNIIMHHLRTPMTSLNFATSLLCNDIQKMNIDSKIDSTCLFQKMNQHKEEN